MTVRLLSYNIRFGGTGREALIAEVVRAAAPDVVILQEATDPRVVARLAADTGLRLWGAQPGHSTAFLSRLPVAHYDWHRPREARHPFLEVVLGDGLPRIFGLHLVAQFSRWTEARRVHEIRSLLRGIGEHDRGFHLVVGDFNALAPGERLDPSRMPRWIQALIWVSGRDIARTTIQTMLDARYVDAYRLFHPPDDPGYTFPVWDPHVRLDYVFTPEGYAGRVTSVEVVREPAVVMKASDHMPLLVEIAERA